MRQWLMRITAYAERLLADLEPLDWSHSTVLEMQRNWIGQERGRRGSTSSWRSKSAGITVFTTRPDTLFGRDLHGAVARARAGVRRSPRPSSAAVCREYQQAQRKRTLFGVDGNRRRRKRACLLLAHQSREQREGPHLIADACWRPTRAPGDHGGARHERDFEFTWHRTYRLSPWNTTEKWPKKTAARRTN